MITYEVSETINAEPRAIFRYLSNVDLYSKWMALDSAEVVTPEIQGQGRRWRAVTGEGPFLMEDSEFEEARVVGYRTIEGPFDWTGGFRLQPLEGATRITSYGQIELSGLRRLMAPMIARAIRKSETAELTTLKQLVEGEQS
jgi:hypothetical protein